MTKNRRYEVQIDAIQDARRAEIDALVHPISLPQSAYGPRPFEQVSASRSVFAWLHWTDGTVTRVEGTTNAWNDKAVVVEMHPPWGGGPIRITVWRNAVTYRVADAGGLLQAVTLPPGFELAILHGQAPRLIAPSGQVLAVSNVWEPIAGQPPKLQGAKLAAYRAVQDIENRPAVVESDVFTFAEAHREIRRWLALQVGERPSNAAVSRR